MDHVAEMSDKFSLTTRHVVDFKVGQRKKGTYFGTYSISPRRRKTTSISLKWITFSTILPAFKKSAATDRQLQYL